jgi:hypothetical protein
MTETPNTPNQPLPPGGLARLDQGRAVDLALEIVDKAPRADRERLRKALRNGARPMLDMFDQQGFARLGIVRPSRDVTLLGRIHWTALLPETEGVEIRPESIQ